MLPLYPEMKKLEMQDKEDVLRYTSSFPPYSDYSFTSLWSWNIRNSLRIAQLHGNLVIRFEDYIHNTLFYSFLGMRELKKTIKTLQKAAHTEGIDNNLYFIPQTTASRVRGMKSSKALGEVTLDKDNLDYIYNTSTLTSLRGPKLKTKRNSINRYIRTHGKDTDVKLIEAKGPSLVRMINKVSSGWKRIRGRTTTETKNELLALRRCLRNKEELGVTILGLYIKGTLQGFSVIETCRDGYGFVHFEKVSSSVPGCMEFLTHSAVDYLYKHGCTYVNYQQDLGIMGMRKTKRAWNPSRFLKKYILSPAK
jgi:hypothetical protein